MVQKNAWVQKNTVRGKVVGLLSPGLGAESFVLIAEGPSPRAWVVPDTPSIRKNIGQPKLQYIL